MLGKSCFWSGVASIVLPGAALAHPGHLVDVAGHNHWVAGAAIGAAIVLGAWAALKGRERSSESDEAADAETGETPEQDAA